MSYVTLHGRREQGPALLVGEDTAARTRKACRSRPQGWRRERYQTRSPTVPVAVARTVCVPGLAEWYTRRSSKRPREEATMAIATAALLASEAEFELEAGPHALGELEVLSFEADERISAPFEVTATT